MKKLNFLNFTLLFGCIAIMLYSVPMKQFDYMTAYKESEEGEGDKFQLAQAQMEERTMLMANVNTGKVNPEDWYASLRQIVQMSKRVQTRTGELEWDQLGPDQVGGRTRAFIFDKLKSSRCYTASVSGGIFISNDLGQSWKPVDSLADSNKIMSIGCMVQSKDGDIYAGTGEYWGNTPGGDFGSQFYGNGIYKKEANSETWSILPSTVTGLLTTANNNGRFQQVIDMACDPTDNNIVYAATTKGLFKSSDAGTTWPTTPILTGIVGQIKIATNGDLYAASNGALFQSKNDGVSFQPIAAAYKAAGSKSHVRIAVAKGDTNKVYACGTDGASDLGWVIRSEDGGATWKKLGEGDAILNPLCDLISGTRTCQGWYDMCLAVHPKDDDAIFLGGMSRMYTWSTKNGWVQVTYGYGGATLGLNQVHPDMHEFAFHANSDTMVVVNDGGVYMSYNSYSNYPNNITWRPKNNKYNVTQFYDMAVTAYGELIGGAQDNGTPLVSLKGSSRSLSVAIGGGDGFGVAVSAHNDYQVAFGSVYFGTIRRTIDLSEISQPISTGHCADIRDKDKAPPSDRQADGKIDNVGFNTRYFLAEEVEPGTPDVVLNSFFFAFNGNGGMHISPNAYNPKEATKFSDVISPGVGTCISGHASKDLKAVYVCGTSGAKRINNLTTVKWDSFSLEKTPCLRPNPPLAYSNCTGLPGSIGGIYVDQSDANNVVAVQYGFGGTAKVFYSTNGVAFTGKQGNLPIMPVYTCVIDPDDSKHVVVGTEFGIWETVDITAASPNWVEQNRIIGRIPVYKLRVSKLRAEGCNVLYAGTHARGFFRVPFPVEKTGCDYTLKPRNVGNPAGVTPVISAGIDFNIYPNPTSDYINVSFNAKKISHYSICIYDMNGRIVNKTPYHALTGDNIIKTDISNLRNGNYIVRLEDEKTVIGGKIFTKN